MLARATIQNIGKICAIAEVIAQRGVRIAIVGLFE
jgi:hypothetical protein